MIKTLFSVDMSYPTSKAHLVPHKHRVHMSCQQIAIPRSPHQTHAPMSCIDGETKYSFECMDHNKTWNPHRECRPQTHHSPRKSPILPCKKKSRPQVQSQKTEATRSGSCQKPQLQTDSVRGWERRMSLRFGILRLRVCETLCFQGFTLA